jgi:hypothetical protein
MNSGRAIGISGSLPPTKCTKPYNSPVYLTIPPSIVPSLNFHNSSGSSKGDALLQHLQVNEMTVAVDTTGFRNDTARGVGCGHGRA